MERVAPDLLTTQIDSLAKLEVALHFEAHPEAVETLEALVERFGREAGAVRAAVEGLAASGVLRRDVLGGGHYVLYGLADDPAVREALGRINQVYHHDPDARVEIVKHVMGLPGGARRRAARPVA